ncbi:competence type IV pilus major pilin ComGC [Lactococcus nasutitermitis]|uniref:Competence type IV pilus major pilin ComGC n=1 Tax=Lactococcus nasutitermitis TaxID=1652957 RepID=A0ABV9JG11_9LACT|nr:competence type IV pilus major pilin ComGC [Lactococcus nasutitermitis]
MRKKFVLISLLKNKCENKASKRKQVAAFTLIEMLIVLMIISILILLFVPNLLKEKSQVQNTGESAVVKVVESQVELYELDHSDTPDLSELVKDGMITQKQADSYKDYYAKNKGETAEIAN